MIKASGKITISKWTGRDDEKGMSLELVDVKSHLTIRVEMGLREFAEAITGTGYMDCEIEFPEPSAFGLLGKTMEVKSVPLPYDEYPPSGKDFETWFEKLVAPYEITSDWKADREKSVNFHKMSADKKTGKKTYTVTFRRWV
jgi:hypothetical protein